MSDAIARELALEACHAAPTGAKLIEIPVSDGTTDYTIRSGHARASTSHYGQDDAGTDIYLYALAALGVNDLYGGPMWESVAYSVGDADHVRAALLDWARAL